MATTKRRLLVTLDPELDAVLRRLAKAKGIPQARIVRQVMMAGLPALQEVAGYLEQAQGVDAGMIASLAAFGHQQIVTATQRALPLVPLVRRPGRPKKG
jgi:hypothetical protein